MTKLSRLHGGQQTDKEFASDEERRSRRWSEMDYRRLKRAVEVLVRTHRTVDLPGNRTVSTFDGNAYWELLGALDRAPLRD